MKIGWNNMLHGKTSKTMAIRNLTELWNPEWPIGSAPKAQRKFKILVRACYKHGLGSVLNKDQGKFRVRVKANFILGQGWF